MAKSVRILVVDQSRFSRDMLARVLRKELGDAEVVCCESAAAALTYLDSGEPVDLITTGLVLGDMDGIELVDHLRRLGRNNEVPVVVVSAGADERFAKSGGIPGVSDFFDKAHGYRELVEFVRDFTARNFVHGRILLVEDDQTAGKITHQILEKEGFDVFHTTSGEQAEALVQAMADPRSDDEQGLFLDLIVSDFMLEQGRTAGGLLHLIRSGLQYSPQQLPVLVITGVGDEQCQVEAFRAGANDFVTKPFVPEVLISRVRSLLLVKKQFDCMRRQASELHRLAVTDPLTVVHNRRFLNDHGEEFLADPLHAPVTVMFVDVDGMPAINRERGVLVGDDVLKAVGELLVERLGDAAMVIRFTGERFCALLPGCSAARAAEVAERLLVALGREQPACIDRAVTIDASIGAASAAEFPDDDLNSLIGHADQALIRARSRGGGQWVVAGLEDHSG